APPTGGFLSPWAKEIVHMLVKLSVLVISTAISPAASAFHFSSKFVLTPPPTSLASSFPPWVTLTSSLASNCGLMVKVQGPGWTLILYLTLSLGLIDTCSDNPPFLPPPGCTGGPAAPSMTALPPSMLS